MFALTLFGCLLIGGGTKGLIDTAISDLNSLKPYHSIL